MTMRTSRPRQSGFTLIELLIVVAIIGVIAAILIPNLLDALQKAKQKRTVADMRITGTAMMSWLSDQSSAAAAGAAATDVSLGDYVAITREDLEKELAPAYLQTISPIDGWKHDYEYFLNVAAPSSRHVMAIRSAGQDGATSADVYSPGGFEPTDYDEDIVWTDGFFIRWPQRK
jgi:type II secretion system protein G